MNDQDWLDILAPKDKWNEKHLMSLFSLTGIPESLLDVGCGTGAMVNIARKLGVAAYGVDLIKRPQNHFFQHDLTEPFVLGEKRQVQMVISLEVGEHIPQEYHDTYLDTITNHMGTNSMLIFSAAHPGQGGDFHEAELPAEYWRKKLHDRGVSFQDYASARLCLLWSNIKSPLYWLAANCQYYTK
jgi:SAM-dependent methyltransferase